MALTEDDVRGIADYARIALEGDELAEMCAYMKDPTFHPIGGLSNVMHDDAPDAARAFTIDEALGNAASTRGRSFRVPSILGEEE